MIPFSPELIDAIVSAPEDDAPRLAFADWLDEQGDAAWAEWIRVQCALARPDPLRKQGETRRLEARRDVLAGAMLKALADALPQRKRRQNPYVQWQRGFVSWMVWTGPVSDDTWAARPYLAAVETLVLQGRPGLSAAGAVPALLRLPLLRTASIAVASAARFAWEQLEPLTGLRRAERVELIRPTTHQSLIPEESRTRLRDAWRRGPADLSPAERLRAARELCRSLDADAGGGLWATLGPVGRGNAHRRAELLGGLPGLRGVRFEGRQTPRPAEARRLQPGLRSLTASPDCSLVPYRFRRPGELREASVHGPCPDRPAALRWLAEQPRLRALSLLGGDPLSAAEWADLARCPALRVLHASDAPAAEFPSLVELSVRDRPDADALRRACPALRQLRFRGPGGAIDCEPFPGAWGEWPRLKVGGVSLCVPPWLRREETPAPDPRTPDVVPLALWREWGDADGSDDDLLYGPAVLRLERLNRRVKYAERHSALMGTPTGFPATGRGGVGDRRPDAGERHFALRTTHAGGRTAERFLWPGPTSTVRLVASVGPLRAADAAWADTAARSLRAVASVGA